MSASYQLLGTNLAGFSENQRILGFTSEIRQRLDQKPSPSTALTYLSAQASAYQIPQTDRFFIAMAKVTLDELDERVSECCFSLFGARDDKRAMQDLRSFASQDKFTRESAFALFICQLKAPSLEEEQYKRREEISSLIWLDHLPKNCGSGNPDEDKKTVCSRHVTMMNAFSQVIDKVEKLLKICTINQSSAEIADLTKRLGQSCKYPFSYLLNDSVMHKVRPIMHTLFAEIDPSLLRQICLESIKSLRTEKSIADICLDGSDHRREKIAGEGWEKLQPYLQDTSLASTTIKKMVITKNDTIEGIFTHALSTSNQESFVWDLLVLSVEWRIVYQTIQKDQFYLLPLPNQPAYIGYSFKGLGGVAEQMKAYRKVFEEA